MTQVTSPDGTPPSALSFGAMQFGGTADARASATMFHACRERGVNMFDTAHVYNEGRSEEILGPLMARERDALIVATKANFKRGNSAESIDESCNDSLSRMGLDMIDLFYLHRFDAEVPLEESFEALAKLVEAGKVRAVGVSNFAAWQVMKAQAIAHGMGLRIAAIQPMLNLVKRQAEVELLPMALDQEIDVYPYSPLGGGLLTGKYRAGAEGRLAKSKMYAERYAADWMHNTAADLSTLANQLRVSPATLAVAWAMRRPGVTAPIISARDVGQLMPSLDALEFEMDDSLDGRITSLARSPAPATDRSEEA